jgi:hypothetical protein
MHLLINLIDFYMFENIFLLLNEIINIILEVLKIFLKFIENIL